MLVGKDNQDLCTLLFGVWEEFSFSMCMFAGLKISYLLGQELHAI